MTNLISPYFDVVARNCTWKLNTSKNVNVPFEWGIFKKCIVKSTSNENSVIANLENENSKLET